MVQHPQNYFQLGELLVSPSHNEIMLADKRITLQPKVMAVLDYLARNRDRVVSGEELLTELWPGRVVTPGSVQKSINSLRKAFNELCGDQEMIVHYSKRGYQLVLIPVFHDADELTSDAIEALPNASQWDEHSSATKQEGPAISPVSGEPVSDISPTRKSKIPVIVLGGILIFIGLGYFLLSPSKNTQLNTPLPDKKTHQIKFETVNQLIQSQSRATKVQPHPDGQHLVYVRETLHSNDPWEVDSQLMIKQASGEDWSLANTPGVWEYVAWSPDGSYLVAVERWREETEFPTQSFYEQDSYLYTLHIFSLDLIKNRLLEKYLLSQWQGRIKSVTWADEKTLEFVASQGVSLNTARYRYSILDQDLVELETQSSGRPMISQIAWGFTALVMKDKQDYRLDLLDKNQQVRRSWQLEDPEIELSWLPDLTGVMVYAVKQSKTYLLYWDGSRQDLDLPRSSAYSLVSPVYQLDGKGIYYTNEESRNIAGWFSQSSPPKEVEFVRNFLVFSPNANRFAVSQTPYGDNQILLQSTSKPSEQFVLKIGQLPTQLVWYTDGEGIVYKMGRQIIFYSLSTGTEEVLPLESNTIDPLAYEPATAKLIVFKSNGDTRNLWSLNRQTLEQKQLTFGSLAGASLANGKIYFQYLGKPGLWVLGLSEAEPQLVAQQLPANSKMLHVDSSGIYFVTGGYCRESDIQFLEFSSQKIHVAWPREESSWITYDFHPQAGLLQSACHLGAASVMYAD